MPYELLSKYSLLMFLSHAIGEEGVYGNKVNLEKLLFFLGYGAPTITGNGYAPLSVIKREVARAKKMGLVEIDVMSTVSFTDEGLRLIAELGVEHGQKTKLKKIGELKEKGMNALANQLRSEIKREGFFWYPEEWGGRRATERFEKETKAQPKGAVKASDIKVTRKPAMAKKIN